MNKYEYHIELHTQKTEAEESAHQKHLRERAIALRVACEEGQSILRSVILPEMEKVETAIRASERKCELRIIRRKFQLIGGEAEFEIEIAVKSTVFHSLSFRAEPEDKHFTVSLRTPESTSDDMETSHPYSKITTDFVSAQCEHFIRTVFPL